MLTLTPADITLTARAAGKVEAIDQIAERMVKDGLVDAAYREGLLAREQQTSTYLGHGIAIPHGTTETRDLVKRTGLRVFRFPEGVDWGDGQRVYTAVGIAAKSDEHLDILRRLTHVIGDDVLSRRLHETDSAEEVASILSGEKLRGGFLVSAELVRLQSVAASYSELVALAGAMLWNHQALLQQELVALNARPPILLGDGVWLSTLGTAADNGGVAVVQPVQPISLYGDSLTTLIVISTRDDQHVPLLEHLTELKLDDRLSRLADCKRAVDMVRHLVSQRLKGRHVVCPLTMQHGLHARPAAALARIAKDFRADIWVENLDSDSPAVSARSVTKLIGLGAALGHRLQITADGEDADAALTTIRQAIAGGLGDPVVRGAQANVEAPAAMMSVEAPKPLKAGDEIAGLTGAPGVAIGPAYCVGEPHFEFEHQMGPAAEELQRLDLALATVEDELRARLEKTVNTDLAQIIAMHLELLIDPELKEEAIRHVESGDSAEWGWQKSFDALAEAQAQSTELLLAERAIDIRDVGNRVLGALTGQDATASIKAPHIRVCREIAPSEISELDLSCVKGVVTAAGGVTSHAAILARSLGIPLLVGCGERVLTLEPGTPVIVDCENKTLKVAPDAAALDRARHAMAREKALNDQAYANRFAAAVTTDGHAVEVMANLTASKSVEKAVEFGCEGVGLFRSEFIYMDYPREPTVAEQRAEYAKVLDGLGPERPLIVRTLDVGGDKPLPYMPMAQEENPFLGVRGIRLSLRYPQTLKRQLQALLLAANERPLRIMFPMVANIDEWRQLRALYNEVAADFPGARVELGIMIEVPAAALMADVFAKEVDFFSVGTNDLTQYTLAIDRGHPELSREADPISPSVLRLIDMTVRAAERHGIWVGVCGELAADTLGATILTGLGVRELSMSVRAIPRIKLHLRQLALSDARALASRALSAENSAAVRRLDLPMLAGGEAPRD
ncbi:phosphoenolpyruvate--protein phosphotransferase [Mangrovitalea sediminis]|uniref:phosphoenolpyruvate--protein phosphotransferase n=1 Tax=Mangrovitalea sediminis TaxID=1982043 RepID=UPI000BE61F68|nr:phosphoenolpyruvate--protein phosphotransferase [Mangrovitalea sediminis]